MDSDSPYEPAVEEGPRAYPRVLASQPDGVRPETWLQTAMDALPGAVALLPPREQRLIVGYYLDDRPLRQLADDMGVTPCEARLLLETALEMLRRGLAG